MGRPFKDLNGERNLFTVGCESWGILYFQAMEVIHNGSQEFWILKTSGDFWTVQESGPNIENWPQFVVNSGVGLKGQMAWSYTYFLFSHKMLSFHFS